MKPKTERVLLEEPFIYFSPLTTQVMPFADATPPGQEAGPADTFLLFELQQVQYAPTPQRPTLPVAKEDVRWVGRFSQLYQTLEPWRSSLRAAKWRFVLSRSSTRTTGSHQVLAQLLECGIGRRHCTSCHAETGTLILPRAV